MAVRASAEEEAGDDRRFAHGMEMLLPGAGPAEKPGRGVGRGRVDSVNYV